MAAGNGDVGFGRHLTDVSQTAWASGHANSSVQGSGQQVNVYVSVPPTSAASQADLKEEVKEESENTLREEHDAVLGILVGALNNHKEPMSEGIWLTLNVRGSLISGELIPHWQWFAEQAEQQGERSFVSFFADAVRKAHNEELELLAKNDEDLTKEERARLRQPSTHIHLRDARNFLPDPVPANGYYWRGRIDEVSGWAFGQMSRSS
ncbi:hypothetical protein [Micromonospora sp. WMMD737]|uniref:hypothetical protein n=1 Tax=Micromonospora sp. WMMD737 TaxID=3404113 RepID=UPI003B927251